MGSDTGQVIPPPPDGSAIIAQGVPPAPDAKPTAAGDLTDMIGSAAKALAKVSGPNVVYEALRKAAPHLNLPPALGMPNQHEAMAAGLGMMIPEAEGEAGMASQAAAAPAENAIPAVAQRVGKVLVNKIPGVKMAGDLLDAIKGPTPKVEPPVPTPEVVPETNGIPWGSGGQGPLELRGKMIPPAPDGTPAIEQNASPAAPVTRQSVNQAVDQSLDVQPLKPNVPLRDQIPAKSVPATEPKASSAVQSHFYDAGAKELHVTPKSNPNITYVYGDVSPDQVTPFDAAGSGKTGSGKAWQDLRNSSSPQVARIINGQRFAVKPTNRLATASPDDLTDVLQQSVQQVKKNRLASSAAAD